MNSTGLSPAFLESRFRSTYISASSFIPPDSLVGAWLAFRWRLVGASQTREPLDFLHKSEIGKASWRLVGTSLAPGWRFQLKTSQNRPSLQGAVQEFSSASGAWLQSYSCDANGSADGFYSCDEFWIHLALVATDKLSTDRMFDVYRAILRKVAEKFTRLQENQEISARIGVQFFLRISVEL